MRKNSELSDSLELTRPRIVATVMVTAAAGYLLGAPRFDVSAFSLLLAGVALIVSSANAFNQILERRQDGLMYRTRNRPLAAGRLSVRRAFLVALTLSVLGLLALGAVEWLSSLLGLGAVLIYALAYTPLKRVSPLSLFVGSIPGALPPLIGTTAAEGRISTLGLALFLFLFVWQIPHFLAIGWLHRDDYRRAGFKVFSVGDRTGFWSAMLALLFAATLPAAIVLAGASGMVGPVTAGLSGAAGAGLLVCAIRFLLTRNRPTARALFLASNAFLVITTVGAAAVATNRLYEVSRTTVLP